MRKIALKQMLAREEGDPCFEDVLFDNFVLQRWARQPLVNASSSGSRISKRATSSFSCAKHSAPASTNGFERRMRVPM